MKFLQLSIKSKIRLTNLIGSIDFYNFLTFNYTVNLLKVTIIFCFLFDKNKKEPIKDNGSFLLVM